MKKILISSLLAAAAVGCQSSQKPAMQSSVTDLTPTPAAPVYLAPQPVAMTATPVQPVSYDSMAPTTPSYGSSATASIGGTYTVKHGDTLYGIAKRKYGDGKQWQKIAAANPGLSPSSLKVGQTITLP